jgi:hypothetical protein
LQYASCSSKLTDFSIPTRRELVKNAARNPNTSEVKAAQLESQTHAWTYCPLSQRTLATPIVSDCAGTLYNKDAVLEYLLPADDPAEDPTKTDHEEILGGRIKSLRDVVEVKFQVEQNGVGKGEKRICPITSKELGPHTKAVYLVPCGHAFSESAIKEVAGDSCLQCNESYKTEDVIPILSLAKEDISRLADRIRKLKETGLTHSLKKAPGGKKRKKQAVIETSDSTSNGNHTNGAESLGIEKLKSRLAEVDQMPRRNNGIPTPQSRSGTATPSGGIKNAATASLTAKVLDEQEERNKRRKLGLNDNLKSLFSNTTSNGASQKGGDFMTRGYSIPKRA